MIIPGGAKKPKKIWPCQKSTYAKKRKLLSGDAKSFLASWRNLISTLLTVYNSTLITLLGGSSFAKFFSTRIWGVPPAGGPLL